MAELALDEPAGVLVKTTCVDYLGHVAGSFFLKGCNLRCPYCYNSGLIHKDSNIQLSTVEELFSHLEKRQGILTGLTISGGEPLLNPYTPVIIKKAKALGYKVKLDTNGTLPAELEFFLTSPELKPDFIAMDVKTSPARYGTEISNPQSKFFGNSLYFEKNIKKSADLIAAIPTASREYRTVLVPGLVKKEDITKIAEILPEDASWQFAQFQNKSCLNPAFKDLTPYTDAEINELIDYAKTLIPNSALR